VLLAELLRKLLEESLGFFGVELLDQIEVCIDEDRPEESLHFGLVDVKSIVGPGSEPGEVLVIFGRSTYLIGSSVGIFWNFLVGRLGAKSCFGTVVALLGEIVDDLDT
jgi:hypothetical protein